MASKAGERRIRFGLLLGVPVLLGVLLWFLVPVPFVRGLVVGIVAVPLGLVLALGLFARRMRRTLDQALEPPPLPARATWDYALEATAVDGTPVDFGAFRGRPLIFNYWATWCAPCVAEMPSLVRLREALADLDVGIACVSAESPEQVRTFMERRGFDLPVYTVEGKLPDLFSSGAIPATFILDRQGRIAFRHLGAAAWDDPSVVEFVGNLARAPDL